MRLITWNCQMAFRKKWPTLMVYQPDIMVIQECEQLAKYKESERIPGVSDFLWVGDNVNKGVAVISFNGIKLERAEEYIPDFKYIVPVNVMSEVKMKLWAVWAMPVKNNRAASYVGQVWQAVNYYASYLRHHDTILTGDFNSNAIWDNQRKNGNHTMVVEFLRQFGIESLYHWQSGEKPGEESQPTFFLTKNREKPFHLDYCFLSSDLIDRDAKMAVGKVKDWIHLSDHVPLIVDF